MKVELGAEVRSRVNLFSRKLVGAVGIPSGLFLDILFVTARANPKEHHEVMDEANSWLQRGIRPNLSEHQIAARTFWNIPSLVQGQNSTSRGNGSLLFLTNLSLDSCFAQSPFGLRSY